MVTNVQLKIDWEKANSLEISKRAEYFDNLAEEIEKASENASDIIKVMAGSQECYISAKYEELFSICYSEFTISKVLAEKTEGKSLEEKMEYFNTLARKIEATPKKHAISVPYGNKTCMVDEKYASLFMTSYREFVKARRQLKLLNKSSNDEKREISIKNIAINKKSNKERMEYYFDILTSIIRNKNKNNCIKRTIASSTYTIDVADEKVFDIAIRGYIESKTLYTKEIHQLAIQHEYEVDTDYVNSASIEEKRVYFERLLDKIKNREIFAESVIVNHDKEDFTINKIDKDTFVSCVSSLSDIKNMLAIKERVSNNLVSSKEKAIKKEQKAKKLSTKQKTIRGLVAALALSVVCAGANFGKNICSGHNRNISFGQEDENLEESTSVQNTYSVASIIDDSKVADKTLIKDIIKDNQHKFVVSDTLTSDEIEAMSETEQNQEMENENFEICEETSEVGESAEVYEVDMNLKNNDEDYEEYQEYEYGTLLAQDADVTQQLSNSETYEIISRRVMQIGELPEENILNEDLNADKPNEEICDGYHLTTGNTIYDMPLWEALETMYVGREESAPSYQSALASFSTMANRFEDGRCAYAKNFHDIISRPNQFSVWNQEKASNYTLDQVPDYILKAYYDCFYGGIRNVDTIEFRAAYCVADDRFQVVAGDNNHFNLVQHVDRADKKEVEVVLSYTMEEE